MRKWRVRVPWSATMALLVANALVYVFEYYFLSPGARLNFVDSYALSLDGLRAGHVWQLLTYQFMHGGFWHIFLNCWAIFVFGRAVEATMGKARMLSLYFLSGVVGGLVQILCTWLMPDHFADDGVVGASAGAFGLVAAFAVLYPNQRLVMLLFFVIPLVMRARTLLWLSIAVAVAGMFLPWFGIKFMGEIAHAAHLGGILTGFLFALFLRGLRIPPIVNVTPAPD